MAKRRPAQKDIRAALAEDKKKGPALFASTYVESGSMSISTLNKLESPKNKREAFSVARDWKKKNLFVSLILELKQQYAGYGMTFHSADPAKEDAFQEWLTGVKKKKNAPMPPVTTKKAIWLNRFGSNALAEFLLEDNLVSIWFKDPSLESDFPALMPPEDCEYTDRLGVEQLKVDFGIKNDADKKLMLAAGVRAEQLKRWSKGLTPLLEDEGEFYLVTSRGTAGQGFCYPRIFSTFRTLTQNESMEVGESLLAYMGRLVIRFHKKGFEPKSNTNLKLKDFMWTQDWADGVKRFFTPGKFGAADATGNFDHKIEYVWIDPKLYMGEKWLTIFSRLIWWSGPLGFMLMAKTQSMNWMTMFQTEMKSLRAEVSPHIEFVLNAIYDDAPGGIKISFSDECFKDSRLLWDMIKTLMQQGAGSLQTALKQAGLCPIEEGDNNEFERDPKNEKRFGPPVYDAAHMATRSALATATGQLDEIKKKKANKNKDKGGRNPGSKDGDKVT